MSIRDYVELAAPEPEVPRIIGAEGDQHDHIAPDRPDNQGNQSGKEEARMVPLRLVIDTNVVVSAGLKPEGLQRTARVLAVTKPAPLLRVIPHRPSYTKSSSSSGGIADDVDLFKRGKYPDVILPMCVIRA